jgi:hypothetical protein
VGEARQEPATGLGRGVAVSPAWKLAADRFARVLLGASRHKVAGSGRVMFPASGKAEGVMAGDENRSSGDVAAAEPRRRRSVDEAGRVRRQVVGGWVGTFLRRACRSG